MQKSSGGSDPCAPTPPSPKRSRAETLEYSPKLPVQKRERFHVPTLEEGGGDCEASVGRKRKAFGEGTANSDWLED